ncbi:hypothetical protein BLNAU_2128 [Blattamonas nauphoetae]|uniref:Uncharacterized protein n=1 Tax=Blattamonas nauphoetae TaxID=2049346 RepID=A0ABQ9YH89_9EUKA|nr:hypothetical protein BLNAU_2128 [Blattamonas nauphoetae]
MLGYVVSLTSSHLSGSTIRDVNTGGSVLCSNSSFSSLPSSPVTESNEEPLQGTITRPDGSQGAFADGVAYFYSNTSGDQPASFAHCHFTGGRYSGDQRPVAFFDVIGPVSIVSCSFKDFASTVNTGGAIYFYKPTQFDHTC